MRTVSATRMELLAHRAQINLARQGLELLEQKRTALMKEFLRTANTVMEHSDVLQHAAAEARLSLARAEAIAGTETVRVGCDSFPQRPAVRSDHRQCDGGQGAPYRAEECFSPNAWKEVIPLLGLRSPSMKPPLLLKSK